MKTFVRLLFVLLILVLTSCSSTLPGGLADSSSPADFGEYEVLGPGQGQSKGTTVFGIQSSKADLRAATEQAIRSLNGDSLVNVRWYIKRKWWFILPVVTTTVTVKGDVIKFKGGD